MLVGRHSSTCSTMRTGSSSRSECPSCLTNGPSNLQLTRAHTAPHSCSRSASVTAFIQVKMRQLKIEGNRSRATRTVRTVRVDCPPVCGFACGGCAEMSVLPIAIRLVVHPTIVDPAELGERARSCRTFEVDGRQRRVVDPDPGTKAVLLVFKVLDEENGPSRRRAGVQNGITGCKRKRSASASLPPILRRRARRSPDPAPRRCNTGKGGAASPLLHTTFCQMSKYPRTRTASTSSSPLATVT